MVFKLERRISGKIQRNVFLGFEQFSKNNGFMKITQYQRDYEFRETNAFIRNERNY